MSSINPKQIVLCDEARAALLKGVNALADVVGATLGPGGRAILLDRGAFQSPRSSRDGVTVAKEIRLADPLADLAVRLLYETAKRAADTAGDGTTTATVIAQRMFVEGIRLVAAGANPTLLKRGIDAATRAITGDRGEDGRYSGGTLASLTIPIASPDQIAQVGTLSANSDPAIGQMIAAALAQVGKDGTVTVEESQSLETTLEVVEGMQFNQGYLSPYFITDPERMEAVLLGDSDDNSSSPLYVYLHEKPLRHMQEILPVLTTLAGGPGIAFTGSLLIVAEDITDSALAFLAVNKYQGRLRACAVKGPGFGDRRRALFDDLAVLTGATLISPELGLKPDNITREMLGRATKVTVTKDDCTVVGGMGRADQIDARRADLREQVARASGDYDRVRLEERLAKLTGGVAVVKVGGQTEAEMKERKDRAEDAMYATRAAVLEGIVPGGGVALIRAVDSPQFQKEMREKAVLSDTIAGWQLVVRACEEPLRRIVQNAGGEGGEIVAEFRRRIREGQDIVVAENAAGEERKLRIEGYGYNAATGEFTDLLSAGIIDPARVTRTALLAASSIAGLLLTNEAIVADDVAAAAEVRKSLTPVMPGGQQQMLQY